MARPVDAKTRRQQHEEREFAERYGTPVAPAPAPPTGAPGRPPSLARRAGRGIVGWFKTAIITLGVAYLIGFGLITWWTTSRVSNAWRPPAVDQRVMNSVRGAQPAMTYRLPPEPGVSPLAAGEALAALQRTPSIIMPGIKFRRYDTPPGIPWRGVPLPATLFPPKVASPQSGTGLPRSPEFLTLARGPLTADQRKALQLVGSAPVWREFDLVARAPSVDYVAGRFELPFGPEARAGFLSYAGLAGYREFVHASIMRSAWHLSEGRSDSAIFALRSLISFGAKIGDIGSSSFDTQAGAVYSRLGADALVVLFRLLHDARGDALAAALAQADSPAGADARIQPLVRGNVAETQRRLIEMAKAQDWPRALRLELALTLRQSTCGSFRGILTGPSPEAQAAIDAIRRDFVRFPSDAELLNVYDRQMGAWAGFMPGLSGLVPVAEGIGSIYFNSRVGDCALVAAMGGFGR